MNALVAILKIGFELLEQSRFHHGWEQASEARCHWSSGGPEVLYSNICKEMHVGGIRRRINCKVQIKKKMEILKVYFEHTTTTHLTNYVTF